ncbi:MAG: hypothetical protein K0B10_07110 [Vicingaceae bacterium]|nr:hypothetical protein [Vicingaceae bacterium]
MKFRYLFLTLIALFPILKAIGNYNYRKTINQEELQFKIIVIDDYINWDTLVVNIKLDIPKYYTLKKYILNESDCITCGNQLYTFYYKPTDESKNENDSLVYGFLGPEKNGKDIDSTLLKVIIYRYIFHSEILEPYSSELHTKQFIKYMKLDAPDIDITLITHLNNNRKKTNIVQYEILKSAFPRKYTLSFLDSKNIGIQISLHDLTFNKQIQKDFYKILPSVKIKVEYKGKNEALTKHFQKH